MFSKPVSTGMSSFCNFLKNSLGPFFPSLVPAIPKNRDVFDPTGYRLGLPENLTRAFPEHATARVWARAHEYMFLTHTELPKDPKSAVRYADKKSPYGTHPAWCAMQMMTEHSLPQDLRVTGALALLFHDILEDTHAPLPCDTPGDVAMMVREMTFVSSAEEKEKLWDKSIEIKLLKLYDKLHTVLEARYWAKPEKLSGYIALVERLLPEVAAHYGEINIVLQARGVLAGLKQIQS